MPDTDHLWVCGTDVVVRKHAPYDVVRDAFRAVDAMRTASRSLGSGPVARRLGSKTEAAGAPRPRKCSGWRRRPGL